MRIHLMLVSVAVALLALASAPAAASAATFCGIPGKEAKAAQGLTLSIMRARTCVDFYDGKAHIHAWTSAERPFDCWVLSCSAMYVTHPLWGEFDAIQIDIKWKTNLYRCAWNQEFYGIHAYTWNCEVPQSTWVNARRGNTYGGSSQLCWRMRDNTNWGCTEWAKFSKVY